MHNLQQGKLAFADIDQGATRNVLNFDPIAPFDLNGRGIAMARMLGFVSLEYQGAGNVVVARAAVV